jgi:hypothetical protein
VVKDTGGDTCELSGVSVVNVTGKVAAFGSRLMNAATDQLLKIFFANVLVKAQEVQASLAPAAAAAAAPPAPAPVTAPAEQKFNALAFIFAIIKTWFAGLRGRPRPS